jgi:hypothetical protein
MPSSGDPNNLQPNLTRLGQLVGQVGSKLSYDKKTGRFSIQRAGNIQSITRTIWKESVSNEADFGGPIRELFAAAHAAVYDRSNPAINQGLINNALDGLKALRNSYAGDQNKLAILNAVIEDATVGVKKDPEGVIALRDRYKDYLRFGFAQVMFLPESNPGVCYSFTVHWARRILMNRTYFGMRKHHLSEVRPSTLDLEEKKRIMKKVDRTIRPLEAELKTWQKSAFGTAVMHLGSNDARFEKYGNLRVFQAGNERPIGPTARGSEVMDMVLQIVTEARSGASIFLVNLRKGAKGHTIGIHLEGALHFYDSNFGEFAFPIGSDEDLQAFLDEWWNAFYKGEFDRCALESVSLSPNADT